MRFIIFFFIVFTVLSIGGYYIYNRFSQAFSGTVLSHRAVTYAFFFLVYALVIGSIIQSIQISWLSETVVSIGAISLGVLFYTLLFVLFFDLIRFVNYLIPFFPEFITSNYQKVKLTAGIFTIVASVSIVIYGNFNALNTKIVNLDLKIDKPLNLPQALNIVAVSDIHLGSNMRNPERLVRMINELKPDIVLIGGDIIDSNIELIRHYEMLEKFKGINTKYGIFSCVGNHEYISRAHEHFDYFEENGITMLKDSSVLIDDAFYVIGRDDVTGKNFTGEKRKTLKELMKNIDPLKPVFLLDHQPYLLIFRSFLE